jgi:hypothetical protein
MDARLRSRLWWLREPGGGSQPMETSETSQTPEQIRKRIRDFEAQHVFDDDRVFSRLAADPAALKSVLQAFAKLEEISRMPATIVAKIAEAAASAPMWTLTLMLTLARPYMVRTLRKC